MDRADDLFPPRARGRTAPAGSCDAHARPDCGRRRGHETAQHRRRVAGAPADHLGIYNLVWWYKVNAEMAAFDRRSPVNPAATLLAFLFGWLLVIPPYLAAYGTGQRIAERQRAAGLAPTCSPALGIVLMFVFGLTPLYYQAELNKIVERYGPIAPGAPVALAA